MTVTTVYCTAETGGLSANKNNGDFTGALSGAGSESWSDNQWRHTVGNFWHSNNRANIAFMIAEFDLSSIPSGDTITDVDLDLYGQQDQSSTDFNILAAVFTPASPWDSSDWQTGTDLAALTDLASINTSSFNASGYNTFNSAALTTAVNNASGTIAFILWSDRTENANWPGSSNTYESVNFYSYGQGGTSQDPRLVITHEAASSTDDTDPNDIVSLASVGQPTIGQVHALTPSNITAQPSIGQPTAGAVNNLTPDSITSQPSIGTPTVGQVHAVQPNNITSLASVGNPTATGPGTDATSPNSIVSLASVGNPTVEQLSVIAPLSIVAQPSIGNPTVGQIHALSTSGLTVQPTIGTPELGQIHNLSPASITAAVNIGKPTANKQALAVTEDRKKLSLGLKL